MNHLNFKHSLKMPLSTGTVCTPYDSRMLDKRAELQGRIASRTRRQLKLRNNSHKMQLQQKAARSESQWVLGSIAMMALVVVSPFFLILV